MSETKVIERIRKMLALAAEDSGGTEAERSLAAERAQELMLKHRIDEKALAQAKGKEALPGMKRHRLGKFGLGNIWKGQLAGAIGRGVGVDAYWVTDLAARRYTLVGRPEQIDYVVLVMDWIIPQLERECVTELVRAKEDGRIEYADWMNVGDKAALSIEFKRSFYEFAVERIDTRLARARREAEQSQPGMELVLSDKAALEEFYGDNAPKETPQSAYEGVGAMAGYDAGDRVDLNPSNKVGRGAPKELGDGS